MSVGNGDFETPGAIDGAADQWSFDANCDVVMTEPGYCEFKQPTFITPLFDTNDITVGSTTYATSGSRAHIVIDRQDHNGDSLWTAHVIAQTAVQPVSVYPFKLAQQDDDGDIYMMFRVEPADNSGTPYDFNVDLNWGDGVGVTTLGLRHRATVAGYTHFQGIVAKFDGATGEVLWASRLFDVPLDHVSGFYWWGGQLRWESASALHFVCSYGHRGNELGVVSNTATFMPDTDGATTDPFTDGKTWLVTVNPATGVVSSISSIGPASSGATRNSWEDGADDNGTYMRLSDPMEPSVSGYVAQVGWTRQTGFVAGYTDEMVYEGGGAPSAYPTDIAWDPKTGPNQPLWNHAYCLVKDGVHGPPRWVLEPSYELASNSQLTMMSFAKPVPGTDDFLLGIWHGSTAAPTSFALRSNSTLQSRTYNATIGFGMPVAPLYGGYVMRIADNGVSPDLPTISWAVSLQPGSPGGFEGSRLLGQSVIDTDEGHVLVGTANGNSGGPSAFRISRDTTMGSGEIYDMQIALEHGAPTDWNTGLALVDYATGEVLKMISFESGTKVDVTGEIVIKGREYWVPVEWIDEVTFGIEAAADFGGTTVAQPTKETITNAGHRVSGWVRLDRADLLYKGFIEVHDDANGTTKADSGTIKSGRCEVTTDLGEHVAEVGTLFTGPTPTVINTAPPVIWTADTDPGADPLPAWASIDSGTGVISGTPTGGDLGQSVHAARAHDALNDLSRSGAMRLTVEQQSTHRWPFDELAGTSAVADRGGINGTYQANHVKGVPGVIGTALDGPFVTGGEGVTVNSTISFGAVPFTFLVWIKRTAAPTGSEVFFSATDAATLPNLINMGDYLAGTMFWDFYDGAGGYIGGAGGVITTQNMSDWGLYYGTVNGTSVESGRIQNGVVNDGTPFTSTLTGPVPTVSRDVMIGAYLLSPASRNPWAIDTPRILFGRAIPTAHMIAIANYEMATGQAAI